MGLSKLVKAMKTDLLVTPLHEQWLATHSNVELTDDVAEFVRSELVSKQRKRSTTWSSSSLGYCARKHVYQYMGAPRERGVDADLASIFIHGTWTHLKWQASGKLAGWLGPTEVSCAITELNYTGTIDGILASGIAGWEFKSINKRGFDYVLSHGPKHEHLLQITGYMLATGLRLWSLMYECKDDQQYKEFVVRFDPELAAAVENELRALNTAVQTSTLPAMLPGCVTKTGSEYRNCAYRDRCATNVWPASKLIVKKAHA